MAIIDQCERSSLQLIKLNLLVGAAAPKNPFPIRFFANFAGKKADRKS